MRGAPSEVAHMGKAELRRFGRENFANLDYRVRVAELISGAMEAKQAILFDDAQQAIPENQRSKLHGVPGYERALFPGLLLAPGFEDGVKVVVGAPPNPAEVEGIRRYHAQLQEQVGKQVKYGIYFESKQGLREALSYSAEDPEGYMGECRDYAAQMSDPAVVKAIADDHQIRIFERNKEQLLDGRKSVVWPFQVTDNHVNEFAEGVKRGEVVMPDKPEIDKAFNNYLLRENGFADVPAMHVVGGNGQIIESFDELMEFQRDNVERTAKTPENTQAFATGIVDAVNILGSEGKKGYIKLDSNGVSGLSNVDPSMCPEAYDLTIPYEERVAALSQFIEANLDEDILPPAAVVEEFVKAVEHEGVTWDGTVCGALVDGEFYPTSVNPFLTQNAEYVSQWNASSASDIGENPEEWDAMFDLFDRMGTVLAEHAGYKNGVLAGDVFKAEDGRLLVHDFNFRRGGRSTPEVMIAIQPGGWFENQTVMPIPDEVAATMSGEELFDVYTKVCSALQEQGIQPFATAFGYFSRTEGGHAKMKFKTMTPTRMFDEQGLPRSEHKALVDDIIHAHIASHIG